MIQRVQSIWLFLAGLTLFLLLLLPIITKQSNTGDFWMQVGGLYHKPLSTLKKAAVVVEKQESYPVLFGGTILISLMCVGNIFTFRNRDMQKRITLVLIGLNILLIIGIVLYVTEMPGGFDGATFNAGGVLPLLSVVFCILALRGIRRDEQLIRSADRLR